MQYPEGVMGTLRVGLRQDRPKIRPETFRAALALAGLTMAAAARELGLPKQNLHVMVGGGSVSARVLRDLPLILAVHMADISADAIRAAVFTDGDQPKAAARLRADRSPVSGVLERRIAALSSERGPR